MSVNVNHPRNLVSRWREEAVKMREYAAAPNCDDIGRRIFQARANWAEEAATMLEDRLDLMEP